LNPPRRQIGGRDRFGLLPLGTYLALSLLVFGRDLIGAPGARYISAPGAHDPSLFMWCLVWWPHAIAHGLNPFLTKVVWSPIGVNLAWVTSIPAAALLVAPLTRALGPIASFNALCLVSPVLAGWGAFLLCRDLEGGYWPSILGGYLFGFSPYMLGQMQAHLFLLLIFPVPFAVWLTIALIQHRIGRRTFVALAALLLTLQFGFSMEVFATMTMFAAIALMLAYYMGPREWRAAIRGALPTIALGYGFAALALAPYIYHLFAFGFPHTSIVSPKAYSSDLLNFVLPTPTNLIGAILPFAHMAMRYPNRVESDAYLAAPLIVIAVIFGQARWKSLPDRFLVVMFAIILLSSLGPRLHIAGYELFGLPWKLVDHLPLIKSALPARFMMYAALLLAILVARWFAEANLGVVATYAFVAVIAILTCPSLRSWSVEAGVPSFFTGTGFKDSLRHEETVVIVPYGQLGDSMLWQAVTGMYFRMAGGHTGPTVSDDFIQWPAVGALHFQTAIPDAGGQMKAFLASHDVGAIIVDDREGGWLSALLAPLGVPPRSIGGVELYDLPAAELAPYRNSQALDFEARFDRARFAALLDAAQRYIAGGGNRAELTPLKVQAAGLLPAGWVTDPTLRAPNGLYLGPAEPDGISVGVGGSYDALKPVIEKYRSYARTVYFPYPQRLSGPPEGNRFMRLMVMDFSREGLAAAAAAIAADDRDP
jgi:hypothetical protein